jgi:DNA-binding transcriptional MerR regulator
MLKIGTFSRIANVSIRLLHYYDELGLFKPAYIDPESGYRFYRTAQIKDLNKLLAVRDLGLSLEQIKEYVESDLSTEALRGMLMLKKSQLRQELEEELLRLRRVEYRLKQLEAAETPLTNDVIIKPIEAQYIISVRDRHLPIAEFGAIIGTVFNGLTANNIKPPGLLTILEHSETFPDEYFDLEVGFAVPQDYQLPDKRNALAITTDYAITMRELPAVQQMATLVHIGPWGTGMRSYVALGRWIEQHGFEIAGATREVYMEVHHNAVDSNVVEFQLPIVSMERTFLL